MDLQKQLQARPSFAQAGADYKALLEEVRDLLSDVEPDLTWDNDGARQSGESFCSEPFTDVPDARYAIYDVGTGKGALPEDRWSEVQNKVATVAAQYGFTEIALENHTPGNLILVIAGPWDNTLELRSAKNTTLAVFGGCFIKSEPSENPSGS
ncbi:LppA family lipoprotein [Kineosporia sp. NBRC 101731]|uniref:LppA family lipoprotein n=1 Tax=Kineosporia sp. NBRC 101731 TaxID=3032199 RepID=UPI0024A462DC|nr:LppA family lipoprotein [Kineosporia sp. NBRC 101731]GLY28107.1 hypothetical protein Kisp02_14720 [Kineosporia sp. NBRC 101731]